MDKREAHLRSFAGSLKDDAWMFGQNSREMTSGWTMDCYVNRDNV